jgi:phospholipase B1
MTPSALADKPSQSPALPPVLPHLPLECSCALLPGPAGDYTRSKMDEMGEAYDAAVLEVIREWEEEADPSFGAIWCVY